MVSIGLEKVLLYLYKLVNTSRLSGDHIPNAYISNIDFIIIYRFMSIRYIVAALLLVVAVTQRQSFLIEHFKMISKHYEYSSNAEAHYKNSSFKQLTFSNSIIKEKVYSEC